MTFVITDMNESWQSKMTFVVTDPKAVVQK